MSIKPHILLTETPNLPVQSTHKEKSQYAVIDAFLQNNRLDHITQLMSYHPQYLEQFLRTHNFILKGDGPLSFSFRHYIAIMAAARHRCSYLINLQKREFLLSGGESRWLEGFDHIPQKLKDLNEINKILAHQPWLISKAHIESLTKGSSWSLSELVQAIVLLAHFHALSSFVFGCCANDPPESSTSEAETQTSGNGHKVRLTPPPSPPTPPSPSDSSSSGTPVEGSVECLMKKMQSISERKTTDTTLEDLAKGFEKVENQNAELQLLNPSYETMADDEEMLKFTDNTEFAYKDFAGRRKDSNVPTFRVQDYSWDDHGFCLVNRLYNDVGNLLDEKFKVSYNLTYYTMGKKSNVDTSPFRRAVWNYIQSMYGIRHDDYDYREVNELLERNLKSYIKTLCCFPFRTTKEDYDNVMRGFLRSEKIHVNLMILEARLQAELLYALRAVMRYMT